jgi:hypothetical protein
MCESQSARVCGAKTEKMNLLPNHLSDKSFLEKNQFINHKYVGGWNPTEGQKD